jgi:Rrf2 family protein
MQITRASDYAVRVMIHLAGLPPGSTVRQRVLSQETDVSGHFLSKVLQQLVRSRLIRSQRGSGGGFALAVPAAGVSLLEVVEAIEGPVRLNQCIEEGQSCDRKSWCPAHRVWAEAQAAIVNVLGAASMASLAAQARSDPRTGYRLHQEPVWISGVPQGTQKKPSGKRTSGTHGRRV